MMTLLSIDHERPLRYNPPALLMQLDMLINECLDRIKCRSERINRKNAAGYGFTDSAVE